MQISIHSDFKLNGKSFSNKESLLTYVKEFLPDSFVFLEIFLDDKDHILVQTSGSTGKPKQIRLSKKAMLHSAEATQAFFNLSAKTKALHCLPSQYIAGKMMWVRALHAGWHLDVIPSVSNPLKNIEETYDFSAMVPLQAQNSLSKLTQIKKLIIGGAPISLDLENKLKSLDTAVYQTYGMTETITHIALRKLSQESELYYKSLPNIKLSSDDNNCLIIEAPLLTNEKINTNDIVKLVNNNQFRWLGRYDNVINSGGIKLFPEQIEKKLAPFLSNSFFISSFSDAVLGQKLVLIIESDRPIDNLTQSYQLAKLSKYETPKEVFYLDSFKRNNGKLLRKKTQAKISIK